MENLRNLGLVVLIRKILPNQLVNGFWHLPISVLANIIYGFPSHKLKIIGVTGTKGKTSVAHLIHHILNTSGKKAALLSTISAQICDKTIDTGLHVTNPSSFTLQKLLKYMVEMDCKYAVLEITSMGMVQYRNWGIPFALAVYTSIKQDHLDYHGSQSAYELAKAKLINQSNHVLVNKLDPSGDFLTTYAGKLGKKVSFYFPKSDINSQNATAAIGAAKLLGIKGKQAEAALDSFPGIPGRMNIVQKTPFTVIIDFAHTPDSLQGAVEHIRQEFSNINHFIGVFGCAGERDRSRRKMGFIAAKLLDAFIITSEDPRSEKPSIIAAEIASYAEAGGALQVDPDNFHPEKRQSGEVIFTVIENRTQAINLAIRVAKKGDMVGLFGKGHEKSMCFSNIEQPWSENDAVQQALALRRKKSI
jgi:UDP-N-acetylmuramoyl-L-alanyl-D-glutamate--2,6-diaminopimelate ligase